MAGTRWIKIDTSYLRNPKIIGISGPAVMLHLASILWSADHLTDGNLPGHVLPELAYMARISRGSAAKRADELVKARLWESYGAGWHLHDFETMNAQALRGAVERQRQKWRAKKGYSTGDSPDGSPGDSPEGSSEFPRHESYNDNEW